MEVFERDCLIYLGTCVALVGTGKPGRMGLEYTIEGETLQTAGQLEFGEVRLLPLGLGETATIRVEPARGLDVGAGPGRRIERKVMGGTVGLILDARGRPLELPEERAACRAAIEKWITNLDLYPQMTAVA